MRYASRALPDREGLGRRNGVLYNGSASDSRRTGREGRAMFQYKSL